MFIFLDKSQAPPNDPVYDVAESSAAIVSERGSENISDFFFVKKIVMTVFPVYCFILI